VQSAQCEACNFPGARSSNCVRPLAGCSVQCAVCGRPLGLAAKVGKVGAQSRKHCVAPTLVCCGANLHSPPAAHCALMQMARRHLPESPTNKAAPCASFRPPVSTLRPRFSALVIVKWAEELLFHHQPDERTTTMAAHPPPKRQCWPINYIKINTDQKQEQTSSCSQEDRQQSGAREEEEEQEQERAEEQVQRTLQFSAKQTTTTPNLGASIGPCL